MATKKAASAVKRFDTRNDMDHHARGTLILLLNAQLADTFDLYSQTKQAHWNVKGAQFFQLHELFDDLAAKVLDAVDMIAERAVQLGGAAQGTARMAGANSRLPEYPDSVFESMEVVAVVAERYAQLAASTREAIDQADELDDKDTADLFTEVSRELDKALWFLEAHLQK
ncbi:MAG: DNA starvation/stationary phase protection protein Dps [Chloroflexota bacterium]|nr:MAG: DNA starvation/stationary phase protection protein Dps [Chloroflexota bacterium]